MIRGRTAKTGVGTRTRLLVGSCLAVILSPSVHAQSMSAPSQGSVPSQADATAVEGQAASTATRNGGTAPEAGDIIVTALKRASSIQSTPISISATTGETLANAGVSDIRGLLQTTPSLSFVDAGPGQTRLIVRGIYSIGEPTVGLYYDEQPVSGAAGGNSDAGGSTPLGKLFDVERVESLRGPQGTLYGSGSMGGTLRVIFNKPTFHTEGAVDANISGTEGGTLSYGVQAVVNVPVVDDKIAVRLVGFDQRLGGYIDNIVLNQKNIDPNTSRGGRALIRIKPSDTFTLDGSIQYQQSFGSDPKWDGNAGAYHSTSRTDLPYNDKLTLYNLTANWDLGPANLTLVGSDMHRNVESFGQDVSAFFGTSLNSTAKCVAFGYGSGGACSAAQLATYNAFVNTNIPSSIIDYQTVNNPTAEIRLASVNKAFGFLDYTVGGFFSNRTTNVVLQVQAANPSTGALNPNAVLYDRRIYDRLRQVAGFGELSAHVTKQLTLTFGARYFDYSRTTGGYLPVGNLLLGAAVTPYSQATTNDHGVVTKTNLSYQVDKNILFYFSASQGFRPGGINQVIGLPASLAAYRSDSLWDYEAGVKTSWLDNHLIFDVDLYRIDWSDMQITGRVANGTFQFVTNAGAARVQGIEANATIRPVPGLTIDGNITISSAKLSQDQVSSVIVGAGVKGDRIPFTPNLSFGAGGQYNFPLSPALGGMIRVDENYQGESYSEFRPTNIYRQRLPAYSLTNLRFGIESPDRSWGAYLYLNNVFNKTAITYAFSQALGGGKDLVTSAMPRTYGLNLRKKF